MKLDNKPQLNIVTVQDSYVVTITPYANNHLTGSINLNNGQLYSFELEPNSDGNAWVTVGRNPPMGMYGNYQVFTSLDGGVQITQVGYLSN